MKSKVRRERLLSVLPRVFTAQPQTSAIGAIVDLMVDVLERFDADAQRVTRDRWVVLASGARSTEENESALEFLGHLLEIPRLSGEETEAYRQRIILTAKVLTHGLTTPGALLSLAIAGLGAEPCSQLQKNKDASIAWGMPLGTSANCSVCQGKTDGRCPNADIRVLDAWVIDNPPIPQRYTRASAQPGERFVVENPSLVEDIPEVTLQALEEPVLYPALQNYHTSEVTLYGGMLAPGEILKLQPAIRKSDLAPFDSHDVVGHHSWARRNAEGIAVVIGTDGRVRNVTRSVYYFTGYAFDLARFALPGADEPRFGAMKFEDFYFDEAHFAAEGENAPRFSSVEQNFGTPRLRVGKDEWAFRLFTKKDVLAVAGTEAGDLLQGAPERATTSKVALELDWWSRPPAQFRLRIPKNLWVRNAEARGALKLVYGNVERTRAAGVQALVDFPIPAYVENQPLAERHEISINRQSMENATPLDRNPEIQVRSDLIEKQQLGEGAFSLLGVFDTTRLDWTHVE